MTYNEVNSSSNIFSFEQTLAQLSQVFFNPAIAQDAFANLQASGNKELLSKVKLSGLQQFHAGQFKASDIYITIAGDITPSNARLIANKIFGDMKQETFQLAE